MNLKKTVRRNRAINNDDVNITPVMNLFLVLIPFLLLTAVFVRIAVLELSLPSLSQAKNSQAAKPQKPVIVILLAITENGFEMKAPGVKIAPIPRRNGRFQFKLLRRDLKALKKKYPDTEDITIQPDEAVLYDTIVKVMDACRESGFPNIAISG